VLALSSCCITVRHQGRVVAYLCAFARNYLLTFDDYGPKTLSLTLDETAIFLGNAFVRPEYRRKGLFAYLMRDFTERYPRGTRFFGHIDSDNVHSFNSHRRLGYVPLLTVICLGLGPARFFFQRPFGGGQHRRIEHAATLKLVEQEAGLALVAGVRSTGRVSASRA
jgi:GNAT superfamily N-acetyltransferase